VGEQECGRQAGRDRAARAADRSTPFLFA